MKRRQLHTMVKAFIILLLFSASAYAQKPTKSNVKQDATASE
jgi:hypothetical protein